MEVKIGIQSVPRELIIETDETQAEIEARLERALAAYLQAAKHHPEPPTLAVQQPEVLPVGLEEDERPAAEPQRSPIFTVTTAKGGRVLIPADKIAFIEFSTDQARRVGFGNIV